MKNKINSKKVNKLKCKLLLAFIGISFSMMSVNAKTLIFEDVLQGAIEKSYDLKKTDVDIKITNETIKESKAEYYPEVKLNLSTEYSRDLTGGTSSISPVGNTILLNNSIYQNAASVGLSYNLFDFGARKQKVIIAKKDNEIKKNEYKQNIRDIKLNVTNTYNEALLNFKELKAKENILSIEKEIFNIQEKLYEAGNISKVEVANSGIKIAKIYNDIDDTKILLSRTLSDLTQYTQESYSADDIDIQPIDEGFIPINLIQGKVELSDEFLKQTPEYKRYQLEIDKKEAELKVLEKARLPQFGFNSSYYWYGSNKSNYFKSFSDLEQRALTFNLSSSMPVFDGFKNKASRNRTKFEIDKLKIEREQKIFELKNYYEKIKTENDLYDESITKLEETIEKLQQTLAMNERLSKEQLIDKITLLNLKEELINKKLDFEKSKINKSFSNYKLKVLSQND